MAFGQHLDPGAGRSKPARNRSQIGKVAAPDPRGLQGAACTSQFALLRATRSRGSIAAPHQRGGTTALHGARARVHSKLVPIRCLAERCAVPRARDALSRRCPSHWWVARRAHPVQRRSTSVGRELGPNLISRSRGSLIAAEATALVNFTTAGSVPAKAGAYPSSTSRRLSSGDRSSITADGDRAGIVAALTGAGRKPLYRCAADAFAGLFRISIRPTSRCGRPSVCNPEHSNKRRQPGFVTSRISVHKTHWFFAPFASRRRTDGRCSLFGCNHFFLSHALRWCCGLSSPTPQ